MAKEIINIGTAANSRNGDPLRTAFNKANQNFSELYDRPLPPTDISELTDTSGLLESNGTVFSHIELIEEEVSFVGPLTTFVKTNYGSEVDYIDDGLAITRGIQAGIYNAAVEEEYNRDTDLSPLNTEWNADGWEDLSDITERTYTTWRTAVNQNPTESIGAELIMHDTVNDKYYGIKFLSWQQGMDPGGPTGGGFSYTRQLIDPNAGKGILFPDGSVQRTAMPLNILTTELVDGGVAGDGPLRLGATVLDLSKGIHKLSNGDYKLINGSEGQVMYLVQQDGVESEGVKVHIDKGRVNGATYNDIYMNPFTSNGVCVFVYTDGAWQSSTGSWD